MDISLVVFWNLDVYGRFKGIVSGPGITGCGDLESSPITRQKVILEGDVSSRYLTGQNLRGSIRPFNGPVDRSHNSIFGAFEGPMSAPELHARSLWRLLWGDVARMN